MTSNHLTFYVQLHVKPEHIIEWKELLQGVLEKMSLEDTFVSCTLHQSLENEYLFTLYERWDEPSVDSFVSSQMSKEYRRLYEERLAELLESPRTASIAVSLQTWNK